MRFTSLSVLIGALSLVTVAAASLEQNSDVRDAVNQLLEVDRGFSASGADRPVIESIPRMFAADVVVPAPGNRFAEGRDRAIEAMRANPDNLAARATWTPIRGGISMDGQHGFTFGYMTLRRPDNTTVPLKYLAYWTRQHEGWRIAAYKRRGRAAGDVSLEMLPPSLPSRIVPTTAAASTDMVEGLKRTEAEFSAEAQKIGIGPAFAKYGSDDAMNMGGPNDAAFVIGAQAISRSVGAGSPAASSPVSWGADRAIVSPRGDLGVTFGMIRSNDPAKAGEPGAPFFTVWHRADLSAPWRYIAE
jgi:hypothetical protein